MEDLSSSPKPTLARRIRLDDASHTRSGTSDLDLSVSRLDYTTMMLQSSPNREGLSIRQSSPPHSANRKVFRDKLRTLSRLHVDEAGSTIDRTQVPFVSTVAMSADTSLASTMYETDVSTSSTSSILQTPRKDTDNSASLTSSGEKIPERSPSTVVQYVMDAVDTTLRRMECLGSCTSLPVTCDSTLEEFAASTAAKERYRVGPKHSPVAPSLSYPSTYDDSYTEDYRGLDSSYYEYSTFDETLDETTVTGPTPLRDQQDIAKVSRFDDATTISSQNSAWI